MAHFVTDGGQELSARYEIWLSKDDGTRLAYVDQLLSLEYSRVVHNVGTFSLILPKQAMDPALFREGYKVEILRASDAASALRYEMVGIITGRTKYIGPNGENLLKISGVDGNSILMHRYVLAQPGTTYARKTGYAGNIAKAYVRESITSYLASVAGISTNSDRTHIVPYFTVDVDKNDGASFTKNYEWKLLFDAANGICGTSTGRGSPVYWNVHPVSGSVYQFRTYANQIGSDLRTSVFIGPEYDNIVEARLVYETEDEVNAVYAVGEPGSKPGGTDWRWCQSAGDNSRMHASIWSYHEYLLESTWAGGTSLWDDANEYIKDNGPKGTFSCVLQELPNFKYGQHWNWGDRVAVSFWGEQFTGLIKNMLIKYAERETIRAAVEIEGLGGVVT